MKNKFILIYCVVLVLLTSFNKISSNKLQYNNFNNLSGGGFMSFLDSMALNPSSAYLKDHLSDLKSLLITEKGISYKLNDSIHLEIIPLKNKPTKFANTTKDGFWYIVYRYNNGLNIHKPEFMNYKSESAQFSYLENMEAIYKLLQFDIPPSGIYSRYSIGGRFISEEQHHNARLVKYIAVVPEMKGNKLFQRKEDIKQLEVDRKPNAMDTTRIDWFLLSMVFSPDGKSVDSSTYLNTTSSFNCSPGFTDFNGVIECDPEWER